MRQCSSKPIMYASRGGRAPEIVVQEVHFEVEPVRGARIERAAQARHGAAARDLVAVAGQHHVAPAHILVQDVLRWVQPLVRLAPPAAAGIRVLGF